MRAVHNGSLDLSKRAREPIRWWRSRQAAPRSDRTDETVALFFYAGHGIEVGDRNFLIPIDAELKELKQEIDLDFQAVPVDVVLRQIETRARVGLVFLDACRDNPLARSLARSLRSRTVSVSSGFARMDAAEGMLRAYPSSPVHR